MSAPEKLPPFRIFALITTPKLADSATELLSTSGIPLHFRLSVRGTAPSEMMDLLGLGDVDKAMLLALLPRDSAAPIARSIKKALKLGSVNSGIGFTLPVLSGTKLLLSFLRSIPAPDPTERKDEPTMTESNYALIAAIVDPGYSEVVMNAARGAGAGGGTVLHSRQIAAEAALSAAGMSIQEEKEIVLIVTKTDTKTAIMQAISTASGMHSEAKGHVISLPIESVIGLSED